MQLRGGYGFVVQRRNERVKNKEHMEKNITKYNFSYSSYKNIYM